MEDAGEQRAGPRQDRLVPPAPGFLGWQAAPPGLEAVEFFRELGQAPPGGEGASMSCMDPMLPLKGASKGRPRPGWPSARQQHTCPRLCGAEHARLVDDHEGALQH
jgi:hypothetical protein